MGGASPARGPINVPALEAFHADDMNMRTQAAMLNDPHNTDADVDEETLEAMTASSR